MEPTSCLLRRLLLSISKSKHDLWPTMFTIYYFPCKNFYSKTFWKPAHLKVQATDHTNSLYSIYIESKRMESLSYVALKTANQARESVSTTMWISRKSYYTIWIFVGSIFMSMWVEVPLFTDTCCLCSVWVSECHACWVLHSSSVTVSVSVTFNIDCPWMMIH